MLPYNPKALSPQPSPLRNDLYLISYTSGETQTNQVSKYPGWCELVYLKILAISFLSGEVPTQFPTQVVFQPQPGVLPPGRY